MKDRIRRIMDEQHLTQQSFAQLLGISPAQLSGIFKDRTKPTLNIVDAIHQKFPQINLSWLLYGVEPMYINNVSPQSDGLGEMSVSGPTHSNVESLSLAFDNDDSSTMSEPSNGYSTSEAQNSPLGSPQTSGAPGSQNSLFATSQNGGVNNTPKKLSQETVKYIDKPQRKITEIRIFYDDQTWETFVPKK